MTCRKRAFGCMLVMLLLVACSEGQAAMGTQQQKQVDQPATKLETFLGKHGRLIVKDFYEVGRISSVGSAELSALVIYEPGSSQKTKGLRVQITESGRLERSSTSFLDQDELQSLSDALSYISDLASKWGGGAHDGYTEVAYVSKGEFKVGFYQKGSQSSGFVESGLIGPATAFVKVPDLLRLKQMVDQTITTLNSK